MFDNLKVKIKELAKTAVIVAEKELGSNKGQQKKKLAIEYIVKYIPVPSLFKNFVSLILSSFIDDAVEFAVLCMEAKNNE